MIKQCILLACVACGLFFAISCSADETANALLNRVRARYNSLKTLQANIVVDSAFGRSKSHGAGMMKVKKPGFLSLGTTGTGGETTVANESMLFTYSKRSNQYKKITSGNPAWTAVATSIGNFGLLVFFDPEWGVRFERAEIAGKENVGGVECDVVRLFADGREKYTLFVQRDLIVRKCVDHYGEGKLSGSTVSTLSNIVLDRSIPASAFRFNPPKSAKLVDAAK